MIIVCRSAVRPLHYSRDGTSAFIGLKDESSSDLRFLRTLLKIVAWDYFSASILVREN
jgi:hypothetical protein